MKRAYYLPLPFIAGLTLISCMKGASITHNPEKAAATATEFAQDAFVRRDYKKAYSLLDSGSQGQLNLDAMAKAISGIHRKGYPTKVVATEYEPLPGEKEMSIFLTGSNAKDQMFYRLAMAGDASEGYKVSGFYRGSGPYPDSGLRSPLPKNRP